jgi:hypothetical protein
MELTELRPSYIRDICIKYGFNLSLYSNYCLYLGPCSEFIDKLVTNKDWEGYSPDKEVQNQQKWMLKSELRYIWEDIFKTNII